jgi:translation initiation factor IF-3
VIGANGEQLGVLPTHQAVSLAEEAGLDLVEVSPKAVPPVCKIMDFGKYKYEQKKKAAESRKHQSHVVVKEVKFRPKTEEHDYQFKLRHIQRFLQEGNKAKVVVAFRGREVTHADIGRAVLDRITRECEQLGVVEQTPRMEGRHMLMILAPRVGKVHAAAPAAPPVAPKGPGSGGPAGGGSLPGGPASGPTTRQR